MRKPVTFVCGSDAIKGPGGHQTLVRATARAAWNAGFDPQIFCVAPKSAVVETDFGVVRYVASPFRTARPRTVRWHGPVISSGIRRFLKDQPGPHLIHGFGIWGWVAVDVSRRLERTGPSATAVISVYDTLAHETSARVRGLEPAHGWWRRSHYYRQFIWNSLFIRRWERYALTRARLLMMNYESVRRLIRESYGDGLELRIMPYSSETAFLDPVILKATGPSAPEPISSLQNQEAPLIVAASRHSPRKGVHILIHALAQLHKSGARFRACLVGGWDLLDAHRRLADRLGLEGVVAITGYVHDSFEYIRRADIFVLPSLEEGSGSISLIEALQAGVAIVASNVDGIPEDVVNEESALLVEPGNASELCTAMGRLIADAGLRQRLGSAAARRFTAKFSPAAFTDAIGALYAELGFTP
jgi:glycosyltransferase involved in cell wall biosynthesis